MSDAASICKAHVMGSRSPLQAGAGQGMAAGRFLERRSATRRPMSTAECLPPQIALGDPSASSLVCRLQARPSRRCWVRPRWSHSLSSCALTGWLGPSRQHVVAQEDHVAFHASCFHSFRNHCANHRLTPSAPDLAMKCWRRHGSVAANAPAPLTGQPHRSACAPCGIGLASPSQFRRPSPTNRAPSLARLKHDAAELLARHAPSFLRPTSGLPGLVDRLEGHRPMHTTLDPGTEPS
jgi:hypothetical protein